MINNKNIFKLSINETSIWKCDSNPDFIVLMLSFITHNVTNLFWYNKIAWNIYWSNKIAWNIGWIYFIISHHLFSNCEMIYKKQQRNSTCKLQPILYRFYCDFRLHIIIIRRIYRLYSRDGRKRLFPNFRSPDPKM